MHGTIEKDGGGTGLVPRATVEAIVAQRDAAIEKWRRSHAALNAAHAAAGAAAGALKMIGARETRFNHHSRSEKVAFMRVKDPQDEAAYMAVARRIVDTDVWSHIVEITDIEKLMDKQAKDDFHRQLTDDPPEVTVDNVCATLRQLAADSGLIFRRGIANCFSKLDRRFRSHDGFKIGSRIILTHMFNEYGSFNYHRDMESVLLDVERTFMVVDGRKPPAVYAGIVGALRDARGFGSARQSVTEDEFFKVCAYKNGNAHVWFKRDDLVDKVNLLLAEHYGAAVGDGMVQDDGGLNDPKTALAKNFAFFPTPDKAAEIVMELVPLYREEGSAPLTILEPSAGTGNLARRCLRIDPSRVSQRNFPKDRNLVDCVEVQPMLAAELRREPFRRVICADFLALQPDRSNLYDRVVMNPPYLRDMSIDHVMHALKFLKPEGCLVAVMDAGVEFRETRKAVAFRAIMEKMNARWRDLPEGSFASVGTYCNTVVVKVFGDGRHFYN